MTTSTTDLIAEARATVPIHLPDRDLSLREQLIKRLASRLIEVEESDRQMALAAALLMQERDFWRAGAEGCMDGGLDYRAKLQASESLNTTLAARLAEVERELANEQHDIEMVCHEVSLVYDHVTNGFASKPNTKAFEVISLADDHVSKLVDEEVKERAESLNTTLASRLKETQELLDAIDADRSKEQGLPNRTDFSHGYDSACRHHSMMIRTVRAALKEPKT